MTKNGQSIFFFKKHSVVLKFVKKVSLTFGFKQQIKRF
jgi:hypothetical protein